MHENTTLQRKTPGFCVAKIGLYVRGNVRVITVAADVIYGVYANVMTLRNR